MIPEGIKLFLDVMMFMFGAIVGSFLNVCIYRMPLGKSIVSPPSHCGSCQTPVAWFDNIPLISWMVLRGKCRHCGVSFSFRYWCVELLTGLFFLGVWLHPGITTVPVSGDTIDGMERVLTWMDLLPPMIVPIYWLLLGGLIVATFIDLDHYIIPDEISIGGVVVGFLLSFACPDLHKNIGALAGETPVLIGGLRSAMGILVGSGIVLWLAIFGEVIFKKEAMGFGDVKFLGMIGAFLGWQATVFTLVFSSFVGAIVGLVWIGLSKERNAITAEANHDAVYHSLDAWNFREEMDTHAMRSSIPYGPFLALGAVVWIFVGNHLQEWYLRFFAIN